ncbi:MAG: LysM peptidoglycan-binding domain-containing protein, partial [Rhizobiales bacterium]|nr:LysM peptidoglycan-binding domain-containing protein [Hyphomicrobiales bacterium]
MPMVGWWRRGLVAAWVAAVVQLVEPPRARADNAGFVAVRLEQGDSLRAVAARYLGDPDAWPVILALNGLEQVPDIQAGTVLRLPVAAAEAAERAIRASLDALQQATEA